MIIIDCPIWNIGYFCKGFKGRGVGVATSQIIGDKTTIKIVYKSVGGGDLYPNAFEIDNADLAKFPKKKLKGVELVYIPLSEMRIAKKTEPKNIHVDTRVR